jgi:hypothetical protein
MTKTRTSMARYIFDLNWEALVALGIFFMALPNTLVQPNALRALPLSTAFAASRNTHFT